MEGIEYYIIMFYEQEKKEKGIKIGSGRLSRGKRITMNILFGLLLLFVALITVLLIVFPNDLRILLGIIPVFAVLIALIIMDTRDKKINLKEHYEEYNRRIDLLRDILTGKFSINNKEKLSIVISKFQEYLLTQKKEDEKTNKILTGIITFVFGLVTTHFSTLDFIGGDIAKWLEVVLFILLFVALVSFCVYVVLSVKKNLNTKIIKYRLILNDLEYIKLCRY